MKYSSMLMYLANFSDAAKQLYKLALDDKILPAAAGDDDDEDNDDISDGSPSEHDTDDDYEGSSESESSEDEDDVPRRFVAIPRLRRFAQGRVYDHSLNGPIPMHKVPIFLKDPQTLLPGKWEAQFDLTLYEVIPFINGINNVLSIVSASAVCKGSCGTLGTVFESILARIGMLLLRLSVLSGIGEINGK